MYTLWKKLITIEDILLGEATDVVKYFCQNYSTATQQIHALFNERAESFKSISLENYPADSSTFRLFIDTNVTFETLSTYAGFVFHSYHGKSECILNRQVYKRGYIVLTDIKNIVGSSTLLQTNIRSSDTYNQLFRLFLNSYFPKISFEHMTGLGFFYEKEKWSFDVLVLNSKPNSRLFSNQEQNLIEMQVLTWMKKLQNNEKSVYLNAKQMLDDQLKYVKALLQTQQTDMNTLVGSEMVSSVIKAFEYDIQDQIDSLVYERKFFNTFAHFHQQNEDTKLLTEIYEHRQLMIKLQPSEPFLYSFWKQLKSIESWCENKDYQLFVNYLQLNTFPSIESLLALPKCVFLDRLGIHPRSDLFDPKLNYIGLLFYLYNDQDKFIANESTYKRGQLVICQKTLSKQTEFNSLFVHEHFYESIFREKPNEKFFGVGFTYEQGKWKYDVIVYSGKHGIHSIYDNRNENLMKISSIEERSIDLIISTIYIHNKWLENLDAMYTIDELIAIERNLIRDKIEEIEKFYEQNKKTLVELNEIIHSTFRNFLQQCKPEASRRKSTVSNPPTISRRLSARISDGNSQRLINTSTPPSTFYSHQTSIEQPTSNSIEQKTKLKKNPNSSKPIKKSFPVLSKTRSKSQETYSSSSSSAPPHPPLNRLDSTKHSKKSSNYYQLWRELCDIEQKLLTNSTLEYFRTYLENKDYVNYQQINAFLPPENQQDEYNLIAKIKIDSQLKTIIELYELKRSKLLSHQEKKSFDELVRQFYGYYKTHIEYAKKYSK